MNSPERDTQSNTPDINLQYQTKDNSALHHYRTEIPNIIFDLNLDVYAFKLYCCLKQVAGDHSTCFQSNNTLAEKIGCAIPKLIESKLCLQQKGLITITKRKNENGSLMPDLIEIVDIWPENMRTMLKKYDKTPSNPRLPPLVIHDYHPSNPRLEKEEPINKNPAATKEEQPKTAAAAPSDQLKDCPLTESEKQSLISQFNEEELSYINQLAVAQQSKGFKPKTSWPSYLAGAVRSQPRYLIPEVKAKIKPQEIDLEEQKRLLEAMTAESRRKLFDENGLSS